MNQYDFVIIGSGTSGAVWAYYLTKEGFSCLMLEAGKEYTECLGGGSTINQCLLDRFDNLAFQDWQTDSGIEFNLESMDSHYQAIEEMLIIEKMPENQRNRNAQLYVEGFEKLGLKWAP
ncbi:MAG: GMC family oxidoreductase N-terminal domain-containing protein [Candidatus Hodarchaeales archaeon]|jgi:choline dehydrogenase-like flavoprotein